MEVAEGQLKNGKRLKVIERHRGGMDKLGHARDPKQRWDRRTENREELGSNGWYGGHGWDGEVIGMGMAQV